MCGLAGFWGGETVDPTIAENMARRIATRGPDDAGVWSDAKAGFVLAHRRLSILDLTPAGHQPMASPCGRYVLGFNGEVYNHQFIRDELEATGGGFDWRGISDTETLLAALRNWGIEGALRRLNGMFAFALWDASDRRLYLARDRMGEKPLYYGHSGGAFLFGSELKALAAHPEWCGEVDRDSLVLYMRHNCVPSPWSIYKGISKLPPAHYVVIGESGHSVGRPQCYWDLGRIAENGVGGEPKDLEELADELDSLLRDSIGKRMAADVPVGAFLSGGYDSTIVAALMQGQRERPVKTFSIGFFEAGYNEAEQAKSVAEHLGTEHTELYVSADQAMAVIPKLSSMYDEPFADSSQIPTYLISELARRHVTVSLSGDGGDELFCGYNRYILGYRAWRSLSMLPVSVRRKLIWIMNRAPLGFLDRLQSRLPRSLQVANLRDRLPKLASVLAHQDGDSFYRDLVSHFKAPDQIVLGAVEPDTVLNRPDRMPDLRNLHERMMYLDMMTYLPDDILTKLDRASMAVSLEARLPLLDHRLVEFAWRVPTQYKYHDRQGKWLLRQVLYRYVPPALMDRPKMGFDVPIGDWLRGPLREWGENLLDERDLRDDGFFDPVEVRRMWDEHVSGARQWQFQLWDVLMFQAWLQESRQG